MLQGRLIQSLGARHTFVFLNFELLIPFLGTKGMDARNGGERNSRAIYSRG